MATIYETDEELSQLVQDFIYGDKGKGCQGLDCFRKADIKIPVCVSIKLDKDDEEVAGTGDVVKLKKIPEVLTLLTDTPFVLVIDRFRFNEITDENQQLALIHRALMSYQGEHTVDDKNDSQWKWKSNTPDIVEYEATLRHFGAYRPEVKSIKDVLGQAAKRFVESRRSSFQK